MTGVGKLQFFSSEAAMRVWIDPQKLVGYGLSIDDVSAAIRGQNVQVPAGAFGSSPGSTQQELTATLAVKGTLDDPQEFGRIVLRANPDGLGEAGGRGPPGSGQRELQLLLAPERQALGGRCHPAVPGRQRHPDRRGDQAAPGRAVGELPDDVEYSVPYDTSRFVDVAIEKVIHTLLEAMVLVFLVMFLFLQNVRYTPIPAIVVPVCLAAR